MTDDAPPSNTAPRRSDSRAAALVLLLVGGCAVSAALRSPEPDRGRAAGGHAPRGEVAAGAPPADAPAGPAPALADLRAVSAAPPPYYLPYVNRAVGFAVEFPIDPAADADLSEAVEDKIVTLLLVRKGAVFGVEYDAPGAAVIKPEAAERYLADVAAAVIKRNGDLIDSAAGTVGEADARVPGREFSYRRADGAVVRYRLAVVGGKLCGASTTTADGPTAVRFLKSFRPTK